MKNINIEDALLLYAVTDRSNLGGKTIEQKVIEAIEGGVTLIQIREKEIHNDEFIAIGKRIKAITDKYNIPLIINDNIEVCKAIDADGIHIGQKDSSYNDVRKAIGKDKIIGVSCQNLSQAKKAESEGADYLGVGAVFSTTTKKDADSVPYSTLKEICSNTSIPVVAIGGINKHNLDDLAGSGIKGIATISAVFYEEDTLNATKNLLKRVKEIIK